LMMMKIWKRILLLKRLGKWFDDIFLYKKIGI
jgi:hypothetical protein